MRIEGWLCHCFTWTLMNLAIIGSSNSTMFGVLRSMLPGKICENRITLPLRTKTCGFPLKYCPVVKVIIIYFIFTNDEAYVGTLSDSKRLTRIYLVKSQKTNSKHALNADAPLQRVRITCTILSRWELKQFPELQWPNLGLYLRKTLITTFAVQNVGAHLLFLTLILL